jgi:hypothetical protein
LPVAHNEDYGGLQAADSKQYFIASVAPSVNATAEMAAGQFPVVRLIGSYVAPLVSFGDCDLKMAGKSVNVNN